jgi:hypothetical protein
MLSQSFTEDKPSKDIISGKLKLTAMKQKFVHLPLNHCPFHDI